jgi:hypothetical protein
MGAYRHNKLIEWALGGTTRHILSKADLPLFLLIELALWDATGVRLVVISIIENEKWPTRCCQIRHLAGSFQHPRPCGRSFLYCRPAFGITLALFRADAPTLPNVRDERRCHGHG